MSWDRGRTETAHLSRLILSAAFLHREFLGVAEEEEFKKAYNGRIHYAFDSDIFSSFALPWQWGPESISEENFSVRGYGQLLPRQSTVRVGKTKSELKRQRIEEDVRAINVVKLLSEFIFNAATNSTSEGKMFQFTSHFRETTVAIDLVRDHAARQGYRESGGVTETLFQNAVLILRARLSSHPRGAEVVKAIQSVAEVALTRELSGPSRSSMALDNYHRLEQWGERLPLDSIADLGHLDLLARDLDLHGKAYELLVNFWTHEFSEVRASSTSDAIKADAQAFAKLAVLNKQLIDSGVSERVVFVTGSKSLVKIAYRCGERLRRYLRNRSLQELAKGRDKTEVIVERGTWNTYFGFDEPDETTGPSFKWFDRLSLHCVRHISAFAKGALVESSDTKKLDNLFHGLFALQSRWNRFRRSDIEKIIEHPWRVRVSFVDNSTDSHYLEVLEQWDELSMRALEAKRSFEWDFPKRAEAYIEKRFSDDKNVSANQLVIDITEQVDRQRDRSMLELSDMGARALLERKLLSVRNPPDLFFSRFSKTNKIFQNLTKSEYYSNSPEKFVADYDAVDQDSFGPDDTDDGDDRQRSYLKFVVLGAIFASAEKWSTAFGHAQRAIRTITRYEAKAPSVKVSPKQGDSAKLTAREAYYLSAVCARMLARDKSDLDRARSLLLLAEDAHSLDLTALTELSQLLGKTRYKSEWLALELSTYYFDRWLATTSEDGQKLTCRDFDVNGIYESAELLIQELRSPAPLFSGPMTKLTAISAATNILQVATIREFRQEDGCNDKAISPGLTHDLVRQCVEHLGSLKTDEDYSETSLVAAYRNAGALIVGLDEHMDFHDSASLQQALSRAGETGSMFYDNWRYIALMDFLLKLWERRSQMS